MIRLMRFLILAIVWFMGLSLAMVLAYRFVPVPVTATMLMDENGMTRDWEPLSRIDRNMVSAVIAGEDGKFCSHSGFDREAIEQAIERNQRGGRLAALLQPLRCAPHAFGGGANGRRAAAAEGAARGEPERVHPPLRQHDPGADRRRAA